MAEYHYIARQDYRRIIESRELLTLIDSDASLLTDAERMGLEEINMHLRVKYDISGYFKKIYVWNKDQEFLKDDLVEVNANEYDPEAEYVAGEQVSTLAFVYRANRDVEVGQGPKEAPLYWDEIGNPNTVYRALQDNQDVAVSDPDNWIQDDSRNPFLTTLFTDVVVYHLMSRSGSIPDIRVKRYDDACKTLKAIAAGKVDIGLPLLTEEVRPTGRFAIKSGFKNNSFY
jgi:hypothetical protein